MQIFEIGPCFRRESGGAQHASEFTMLNLVEAGLPIEARVERLRRWRAGCRTGGGEGQSA